MSCAMFVLVRKGQESRTVDLSYHKRRKDSVTRDRNLLSPQNKAPAGAFVLSTCFLRSRGLHSKMGGIYS